MRYAVKLSRGHVQSIIAGPYETTEEAQMHATRLGLQHREERKLKIAEFESEPFDASAYDDPDELAEAELDYKAEKNAFYKWIKETETTFEVVPHKRGRI